MDMKLWTFVLLGVVGFGAYKLLSKKSYLPGDVNGDGVVDAADMTLVQQIILGIVHPDAETLVRADVNGNGVVDMGDVVAIDNIINGRAGYSPSGWISGVVVPYTPSSNWPQNI
jgi:hypothetical protein